MAIISSIPGVEAEVRVNGERAEEYMDSSQDDTENTAIRYIEAVSGARFTVHCTISQSCFRGTKDMRGRVHVDGERVQGKILHRKQCKKGQVKMDVLGASLVQEGQHAMAPMVFSELDIDEHSTDILGRDVQEKVASVGDICIQLERGLATPSAVKDRTGKDRTVKMDAIGKVPEKALKGKALSHQVK